MTFDLQMFAEMTYNFDSGVGMQSDRQTIKIGNSGGNFINYTGISLGNVTAGSTAGEIATAFGFAGTTTAVSLGKIGISNTSFGIGLQMTGASNVNGTALSAIVGGDNNFAALEFGGTLSTIQGHDATATGRTLVNENWTQTFTISSISVQQNLQVNNTVYTLDIDNTDVQSIDFGGYLADVKFTQTRNNLISVSNLAVPTGLGRNVSFGTANAVSMVSGDANPLAGSGTKITTDLNTAILDQGSNLTGVTVVGQGGKKLNFYTGGANISELKFAQGSDSLYVTHNDGTANNANDAIVSFDQVGYGEISMKDGDLAVSGMRGSNVVKVNATANTNNIANLASITFANNDTKGGNLALTNQVSIVGAESSLTTATRNADLNVVMSGKGVESVDIGMHGAVISASNWVSTNNIPTGSKANVVSIGSHSVLALEGDLDTAAQGGFYIGTHLQGSGDRDKTSESGTPSVLRISRVADGTAAGTNKFNGYQSIKVQAQGNDYTALVVGNDSLKASDTALNLNGYNMIVGDYLNLGDRTDKKVVYLNNGLGKNDWGETVSYSANMTSVKSSSAGGSLILGDFENAVNFYGNGDQDSLFAGYDYNLDKTRGTRAYDTLGSAQGKKAWMGTSDYSGLTVVELVHNGQKTNNFGFVDEDSETNTTADVLALMNGAAYRKLEGSEHQLANLAIGADSVNNFTFKSITEGQHKINYTYDLGKTNSTALVDTSLQGSKSGFDYESDISFYLGFDKGTVLTFDSKDSKQKLNYDGGAVLMGISSIDGSKGGADNILNGETNHAEFIIGSETGATTLSGGFANGYVDTASDTLVGGSKGDQFWVGANMGDDVVTNVGEGDTIVFLGSKFADATLKHDMLVDGDASNYTVEFKDGSTVKFSTATGTKMSDIGSLTCKFDDATYSWNGTEWAKA